MNRAAIRRSADTGVVIVFAGLDGRPALLAEIAARRCAHSEIRRGSGHARLLRVGPKVSSIANRRGFCFLYHQDPPVPVSSCLRATGLTPLHYCRNDDCQLVFASDLHAIFDSQKLRHVNQQGAVAEIPQRPLDPWRQTPDRHHTPARNLSSQQRPAPGFEAILARIGILLGPPPADDAAFAVAYKNALEAAVSDTVDLIYADYVFRQRGLGFLCATFWLKRCAEMEYCCARQHCRAH